MKSIQTITYMGTTRRIVGITVLILWILALSFTAIRAQNVIRKGNTFVQTVDSVKKSPFTYESKDGKKYPIFLSSKGKAYIICKSKKTGKEYKRYLPKVTEELKKLKQ